MQAPTQLPLHEQQAKSPRQETGSGYHSSIAYVSLTLIQRCSLGRFVFLNASYHVVNLLLREKPTLDVLLDHALFINKHADRESIHAELVRDLIVSVH